MDTTKLIKKEHELMECDVDDTYDNDDKYKSLEVTKKHKRKKIRRLVDLSGLKKERSVAAKLCKRIVIIALLGCIIALLVDVYFTQNSSNIKLSFKDFLRKYRNQYKEIVHGKKNYCDQNQQLDTVSIFKHIEESHMLNQELALNNIKLALQNKSHINTIALIGPVGVGKTLFLRTLMKSFPWQENVYTYSWNTYVDDESKKFDVIRKIIENLSECGHNLLAIENLKAGDHDVVAIINQLLIDSNKEQFKRVLLIYVFNLNSMLTAEEYAVQSGLVQHLPDCSVINFKSFTKHELKDCIRREAEIENVDLKEEDYNEIVETIDPFISGCKHVNAKVLIYGKVKA